MKKLIMLLLGLCWLSLASAQIPYQYYSPLNAVAVGPNGLPTNQAKVEPYCCPSTAIEISSNVAIGEDDFQWINIPLNGINYGLLREVTICYQVNGAGNSYISQVRLTEMTTPDKATVKMDDGTDLKSKTPDCYTARANFGPAGTITLALKIVLAPGDKIIIGGIKVRH